MQTLNKSCPICKHEWIVRHNSWGLGEVFIRIDFAVAMFDHLQSHTNCSTENRVKCYSYNGGVNEA